ncbi:hypothetical protein [Hoyosella altamirensis]|uniref:G domain-containing protein n=1 Tax=Hoyosella altamirensis TaxID=616997 RepID=A0A839RUI1_9ACTN|nr:hypothetical protein [Hoyosella altamirensis]MBB3039553.1 hypothetical protein [Hoyosella altamirensis]
MSAHDTARAVQSRHAARILCDDLLRALERHEPAAAARLSGRSKVRTPRGQDVVDVVITGRENAGKSALVDALNAVDPRGPVSFREWTEEDGDGVQLAVVVMVFDAAGSMGSTELGELRRLNANVDRVVFAITKTDMHQNWRQVRDRDAQLLAIHTPRFTAVEIHPIATPLVQASNDRRDTDPDAARALAESAGIEALYDAIRAELPAPGADYVARNLLWSVTGALQEARAHRQRLSREVQNNPEINRLHRVRAELLRNRGAGRSDELGSLRSDVQLARVELGHDVAEWARATSAATRAEIDALGGSAIESYPVRVRSLVRTGLAENEQRVGDRIDALWSARSISQPVAEPAAEESDTSDATSASAANSGAALLAAPRRGAEDYVMVLIGASVGVGLGRLVVSPLSLVPVLDILTIPLTLLLGGAVAVWMMRIRRQIAARARLREWSTEQLLDARGKMERSVGTRIVNAEQQLAAAIGGRFDEKVAATDSDVREIEGELRELTNHRDRELATLASEASHISEAMDRGLRFLEDERPPAD